MRMSIEQIKKNVESYYQVSLPNTSRKQHVQDAKRMFSHVSIENGYSHEQVAEVLACERSNIYNNVKRLTYLLAYHDPTIEAYKAVSTSDMADYIQVGELKLKNETLFTWESHEIRQELHRLKKTKVNDALKSLQWINTHKNIDLPIKLLNVLAGLNQDDIQRVESFAEELANRTKLNGKGTKEYSTFNSDISDFVF